MNFLFKLFHSLFASAKTKTYSLFLFGLLFFIGLNYSCVHKIDDSIQPKNIENISYYNQKRSHYTGKDCSSCHFVGGTGKGWFTVSGSIYDSINSFIYPNTLIRLYTGAGETGTLIYELQGDSLGNFFTTDTINFGIGLYPVVYGKTTQASMGSHISKGSCNNCHGVTTNRIKLK